MDEMFYFFLLFYNVLDLNNQKILWLPSIYQFERTGTNLNHPNVHFCIVHTHLLKMCLCYILPTMYAYFLFDLPYRPY